MFKRLIVGGALIAGWACIAFGQESRPAHDESRWFQHARQLTSKEMGLDRSGEAYFSPDGKRICFQAYPAGQDAYQIYVMNFDGTGLKMVSTGKGHTTCSYFHPSGERMIFASDHLDPRAPESPSELEAGRPGAHPSGPGAGGHPGGAPPGSQPAGTSRGSGHGQSSYAWVYYPGMDIFEYTFATGALKRLTTTDGYDAEGSYSPDGKSIVFTSMRDGELNIYICDADGKDPRRITHNPGKYGGPFFSPDGKRVCYRADRTGDGNLQVVVNNIAGTDERLITDADALHWAPFWHPSGKWLIYTFSQMKVGQWPGFDLNIVRDDGSETHQVTSDPGFDGLPVFSPDGRYLMWTSKRGAADAPQVFVADFIGLTPGGELRARE